MAVHALPEKVLVGANYSCDVIAWRAYCFYTGFGDCSIHIYHFLTSVSLTIETDRLVGMFSGRVSYVIQRAVS